MGFANGKKMREAGKLVLKVSRERVGGAQMDIKAGKENIYEKVRNY